MAQVKVKQKIRPEVFSIIRAQIKSKEGLDIVVRKEDGTVSGSIGKITDAFNLGNKVEVHGAEGLGRVDADSHFVVVMGEGSRWALAVHP